MNQKYSRLEEDGYYFDSSDHWELIENASVIVNKDRKSISYHVYIPIDVARHLQLKPHDRVTIAIRKKKEASP